MGTPEGGTSAVVGEAFGQMSGSGANGGSLPPAVDANRLTVDGRAGPISYYHAGSGTPVLLVHSINAAASTFEMRPIFEHLQSTRSTYAVDLPGFGFSSRTARRYDVTLYTTALLDMLDVIAQDLPDRAVDVIGLSLSCEFVARVASEHPHRVRQLVLINPTGFNRLGAQANGPPLTNREIPGMHALLAAPLWREPLYRALTRPGTIRYFLQRTYGSDQVDEDMVNYDHLTARQEGASRAPLAFLSGRLFSKDVRRLYEGLDMPVWVPHGTRGDFKDFSHAEWARKRANWYFSRFTTGAMPHFERPLEFTASLDSFLDTGAP
ncbi:MAG: alpha/beta hydrolase [Pseudomonadota bacterium]